MLSARLATAALLIAVLALGCAADTPRSAVGLRCGTRPLFVQRALRLQGGAGEPDEEDVEVEEAAEAGDEDAESDTETPEVEEPDDEAEKAPAPAPAPSLKSSVMSMLSSLGLAPAATPTPEGEEAVAEDQGAEVMSTIMTVAVFIFLRVGMSIALRYFGKPATEGGPTRFEELGATLGAGPLGPIVQAVQKVWAQVAALARSSYAAPVVMSLCIVAVKLVNGMTPVEEEEAEPSSEGEAVAEDEPAEAEEAEEAEEAAAAEEEPPDEED